MGGYRPDWVGFLATAVGFAVPLFLGLKIWPEPHLRKRVVIGTVAAGVVLSILLRTALRYLGV
jgi:hypothetical protein